MLRSFDAWLGPVDVTVAAEGAAMAGAEDRLRKALRSDRGLTPFVGAGASLAATDQESCASWKGLLLAGIASCESARPGLKDSGWGDPLRRKLEKADLDDYLAVGTEVSNRLKRVGTGKDFDTWIENTVGTLTVTDEGKLLIRAIRGLGSVVLTTNYDSLIEDLDDKWSTVDWTERGFPAAVTGSKVVVHLHGSKANPRSVVLGSGEYQQLESELNRVLTASFFISHTLAFIGCGDGLSDPHIATVLEFMSTALRDEDIEHFILVTNADHRKLSDRPLSHWITPIPYGDDYDDLRPFLEKLVTARENAVTTQPEASGPDTPLEEGAGLLFVAVTAEGKLQSALQGLDGVKEALQQVESDRAVPDDMAEWDLGGRIREHRRLATKLTESAALLDTSAGRVTPLAEEAYSSTWQLTQPEFDSEADELLQIKAAISALETATRKLVARIARAHGDLAARINIYNGYQDPADHLARAVQAIRKAHSRAVSLRARLGPAQTDQETRGERPASPVTPMRDSKLADDDEPIWPPSLRLAPMLGEARGGAPGGVGQAAEERIPVPPQYSRHDGVFAVKVNGSSMRGYGVLDGDYVTVLRQDEYQDGDMVVAIFGGESSAEAVVKVLRFPDKGTPYLESSDRKDTEDLQKLGEFEVQGKVIGLVRWKIERAPRRRSGPPSAAQDAGQPTLN